MEYIRVIENEATEERAMALIKASYTASRLKDECKKRGITGYSKLDKVRLSSLLGLNKEGFDSDGYDLDGYDEHGYDREGYDHDGYDEDGCTQYAEQ